MNKKIDLTLLLKDCPLGMELDCLMYEDVYFDYVDERNIIHCYIQHETHKTSITFNQYGTHNSDVKSKCVIFPKGKTTWDGFHRPFIDGDIVFYDNCVSIFKEWGDETLFRNYIKVDIDGRHSMLCDKTCSFGKGIKRAARFATEEEKQKLFDAIKANGYKWNTETKTLEKEKFDPKTLQPFDKVLVRDFDNQKWMACVFSHIENGAYHKFKTVAGLGWHQCIPFNNDTKHLVGKMDKAPEFYRYWED